MRAEFKRAALEALLPREVAEVLSSDADAMAKLEASLRHLKTCELIVESDFQGAIQLSYDAARKVLDASLLAVNLRVHQRAGSHASYLRLSQLSYFDQTVWPDLVWMRKLRNHAEYWDPTRPPISFSQAGQTLEAARQMVEDGRYVLGRLLSDARLG